MKFSYIGDISNVHEGLSILEDGLRMPSGTVVELSRCERGFSAEVENSVCKIAYNAPNDLFRAMSFVSDAVANGENISLKQTPAFDLCGVMVDVSRGAVLKVETVKNLMIKMAKMGLNEMLLYTEDTYELADYPYFGYMRGRYTKNEIKEIVSFGNKLGIETIPCIQTLGHLAKPLRWSAFSNVAQSRDILMIGEEETYELIESMIKFSRECFTTKKIHIGMDEAHDVGLGKYLAKHGICNKFDILCEHLARVKKIVDKYGFEPMMWSDMFFRLASKTGSYYDMDAVLPEDLPKKIPEGVTQVYWDYYNRSEKLYDVLVSEHKKMGCPVAFAGGIWTWGVPSVNYEQGLKATYPALKICKQYGVKNAFACLWGDDGAECDVHQALYGLQLFAEMNYNETVSDEDLKNAFKICVDGDADMFLGFDTECLFNGFKELEKYNAEEMENQISTVTKQALYQNPLMGLFDKNHEAFEMREKYIERYENFSKITPAEEWRELYDCHLQLLKVLIDKCDIGNRLKRAYDKNDRAALSELAKICGALVHEVDKYKELREILWYKNNKAFGFESISARLSHLSDMCRIAAKRVNEYLDGRIEKIEELEADRLMYSVKAGPLTHCYVAERMMFI